jgi:predicted RNase H-like HicB family nuclease
VAEDEARLRTDSTDDDGTVMRDPKIRVEKHPDGYVAYSLGIEGAVVGQGDTYDAALADVKSAIEFHVETFGIEVLEDSIGIDSK